MDLLEGLNSKQIGLIHTCLSTRRFEKGQVIFREGDPAGSFYVVQKGKVEILRETLGKPIVLAKLGPNDVFGEMGLVIKAGRTAAAIADETTLAYEIPIDVVDEMNAACGPEPTMRFLENLVCILCDRLRLRRESKRLPKSLVMRKELTVAEEIENARGILEKNLPKGSTRWISPTKKLKPGRFLCKQGDVSDGFYFIHQGTLEVLAARNGQDESMIASLTSPIIAGEFGFLSGQNRTASLRALDEVVYTHFSGSHFAKLKAKYPAEALDVLFSIARLAVYMIAAPD